MTIEEFIRFTEDQIAMVYQIPKAMLGVKRMQNVLVHQTGFDPDPVRWDAYQWPEQRVSAFGDNRDTAISAFITSWNTRMRDNKTANDFRFFGPLMVTAYLRETASGWECIAYAENTYATGQHPTEDEAKADFISIWNESHSDIEDVTDLNIDWQYENAPE